MRGKGEGSVYKRSQDGYWVARVELPSRDGKRRVKRVVRKSKAEAQRALTDLIVEYRKHGDLPTESQTVEQWFTYWLDSIAEDENRSSTVRGYRSVVYGWVIPTIGKVKLSKVTPAHVRRVTDAMLDEGKSSTYALNAHRIMSSSFTVAEREGRIIRNPAKATKAPRKARSELEALTLTEAIRVLQWAAEAPSGVLWATYLLTGARRSEVIALQKDRVGDVLDFEWQIQRLPGPIGKPTVPADLPYRHLHSNLYLTPPKSARGKRVVPLVEPLRSILLRHMDAQNNPWDLLFVNDDGLPYDPDAVTKWWKRTLEELGIDKRVRLHDLRHTTVDLLFEAGVADITIQEIVGHSTRAMTHAYKSRGNRKELERAMLALSQLVSPAP